MNLPEVASEVSSDAEIKNQIETPEKLEELAPKLDALGRAYATGKRKTSVARVWIRKGDGITVNKKAATDYFPRLFWLTYVKKPLEMVAGDNLEVMATVRGGGLTGQAGALRFGIARALVNYNPAFRPVLRNAGLLTSDSRRVERKKYGIRKARRRFQFSKR